MQNLKSLLEILLKEEIDFVLVGGFAAVVHGSTLVTQDLDICAAITDEQVSKLRHALKETNPIHRMNPNVKQSFLDYPKDLKGLNNIYLETDLGILDIMSDQPPVGNFEKIKSKSQLISIYGYKCHVISLDDLIRIKESMKRPKDQQAAKELKAIALKLSAGNKDE